MIDEMRTNVFLMDDDIADEEEEETEAEGEETEIEAPEGTEGDDAM